MAEYLVYACNQYLELDYYKRRRDRGKKRVIAIFD